MSRPFDSSPRRDESGHQDPSAQGPPGDGFTFRPGELLCQRFRIVRALARGGMGELYEADDLELRARIALKTVRADIAANPRVNQRFRREVALARRVTHPNICRIFDLFQHQGDAASPAVAFVTLELLEGETLADRLKRITRLTPQEALPLVAQMGAALAAAHAAGVVHRDFKSGNVMLLPPPAPGEPPRVVVTDFGLAYNLLEEEAGTQTLSLSGEVLGTPDYMAPEQVEGSPVTPATDIYAFGIVMYEMLTGERPFTAETPLATALRRISGPPPRVPSDVVPGLPGAWNRTIMRCLARFPEARFSDARAVVRALQARPDRRPGRDELQRVAAAGAALLIILTSGVLLWRWQQQPSVSETSVALASAPRRSIAVLGFRNLAARDDAQWMSVAFSEMLTTELGLGTTLRTVPGETVTRIKMELALADAESYGPETLSRIRANLNSDLLVLGSYVIAGDGPSATVRLDVRLQDATDGETVALLTESGDVSNILDLMSRIGAQLRQRLGLVTVSPDAASMRASQPASPRAAQLYAEGLAELRRLDARAARGRLEQAIEAEPDFPLTHAALARTWSSLGYDARAREAAERAFNLSGQLPREDRLVVEATFREMSSAWKDAISIWRTLATLYDDDVEYVLRLANAQVTSGAAAEGLATIEQFTRRFPDVIDPRLALTEAAAAETLSDFARVERAATAAADTAQARGARLLVAAARLRQGSAVLRRGAVEAAVRQFEDARRLYEEAGDQAGVARALNAIGGALSEGSALTRAIAHYEEGLAIAKRVGDQNLVARLLNNLAIQQRRSGHLQASLAMNQEALAIRREIGDRTNEAVSLNNLGNVLLDLGDLAGAARHYEESAAMSRAIGDRRSVSRALHNAAEALRLKGELAQSRVTIEEALAIRREIKDPASIATSLYGLGMTLSLQGDLGAAKDRLREALELERKLDRQRSIGYSLYQLGDIAFLEGDLQEARRRHQEALDVRITLGENGTAAESRMALATLALEERRPADAEALLRQAAATFQMQKAPDNEAMAQALLAVTLIRQERAREAQPPMVRARTLATHLQNVLARLTVDIAGAEVTAIGDPQAAMRALERVRTEAAKSGLVRHELEARRAMASIEGRLTPSGGRSREAALRTDAAARGFHLFARGQ